MTNLVVAASNNKIRNCTAVEGAVFKLDRTDFYDEGSIFEYNGANRGGVFYCLNCKIHLNGTQFLGNYAE